MNGANEPSTQKNKSRLTATTIYVTERTMEIPKDAIKADEVIVLRNDESMEIPAGNSKVNENGTLELENGTTITLVHPDAYKILLGIKKKKEEMSAKAEAKTAKARAGKEIGD